MSYSSGLMRLQNGWGSLGSRGYSRPGEWELRNITSSGSFAEISITTPSGELVGKIRSDCQKSIIEDIEFTIDEHGCSSFKLKLNALPPFPMFAFSIIQIKVGNTRYNWYSGEISYLPDEGESDDKGYEFSGSGLRNYLSTLKAKTTYATGQDVGVIVKDLIETWIAPYSPIKYNASKIQATTGVIIANAIELSSMPIETILNTLAAMASCDWGVDGDKDLYFLPQSTTIQKTMFVGYGINTFKPKWNLQEVKNVITVQRQEGAGSGGVGWAVAGIYNDVSSVKKYGRKELNYQVPGYFHDEECDIIGNALKNEKKEPAMSATVSGIPISGGNDFLQRGNYRFVMPFDQYYFVLDDMDDVAAWGADTGITLEKDAVNYIYGDGSIKATIGATVSSGDTIINSLYYPLSTSRYFSLGKIKSVRFYAQSDRANNAFKFAVIGRDGTTATFNISIPVRDKFVEINADISASDISDIREIKVIASDTVPDVGTELWIDRIELSVMHHKHYELKLTNAKYKFSPSNQSAEAEFGKIPPKMENYLAGLFATATELKFTSEILYDTGGGGGGGVTPSTKFVEGPDSVVVDGNIIVWDGTTGSKSKDSGAKTSDFGDHTKLTNKGTNTHDQIDTFITSKAAASGLASLDGSSKVVQDPANATATPTASKIPIADGTGKLASGWIPSGAGSYFKETRCILSNAADTANDITFSACSRLDSTGVYMMTTASPMTKRSDADYAAGDGNGGGTLSGSGWFDCFMIRKDSDESIDFCFNTVPAGHTYYRYVGKVYHTDAAGITGFFQVGKDFYLKTKVQSISTANPGINAVLDDVFCPPNMLAIIDAGIINDTLSTDSLGLFTSPYETDSAPSTALYTLYSKGGASRYPTSRIDVLVDASSRIRYRVSYSGASLTVVAISSGWTDTLLDD